MSLRRDFIKIPLAIAAAGALGLTGLPSIAQPLQLLNVSYDPTRDAVVRSAICTTGDTDSDGVTNGVECPNPAACVNTDGDALADYLDTDSDNDTTLDSADAGSTVELSLNDSKITSNAGEASASIRPLSRR